MRRLLALPLLIALPVLLPAQTIRVGGDGPGAELFTRVAGAAVDRFGRLVVLDQGESRAVVFSPAGKRTQYLGRRGGGPGEFSQPQGMAITGSGQLLVVDPAASRLTRYDMSRGDSARYVGTWVIPVRGSAMCASGDRVFVLGETDAGMLHEFRLTATGAELVRSFAAPRSSRPGVDRPALRLPMTNGPLACSPTSGLVAFASAQLGEVRVWSADGRETGFHVLAPFAPIGYEPTGKGVRYVWPDDGAVQHVTGLAIDDGGAMTVTVATVRKGSQEQQFATWLLDAGGKVRSRTAATGNVLQVTPTRVVCVREGEMGPEVMVTVAKKSGAWCQ